MKQLGAILGVLSVLSLVPAVFAADSSVPPPNPRDRRIESRDPRRDALPLPPNDDPAWHMGDLRPSGLYMGPGGVLHNVPKTQDPRQRIY